MSTTDQMKNIRKKIFQSVESETLKTENRIEKNFLRIDNLEKENDEAMKFLQAFLEKTERRKKITNKIHGVNKHRKDNNNLLLASSSVSDSSIYSSNIYNKTDIVKNIKSNEILNIISRSSIETIKSENLSVKVKEFKKIGENSLYISWTKPCGSLSDFVEGYEIIINGIINQKVRNSRRTRAILYSIDLSKKVDLKLNALLDNEEKIQIANIIYYDDWSQ
ncbi:hypothetical protein Phum_PHUM173530 [Pediculus humanus corporis]|uniref:Uncharacterized protein n=1 Tax=Pediculus humanus subsp. corporis TaxID=121224 RepID=E0VG50_PEDHC|nr:uncharacterized protein Phum_PHUM173530 [Pediculus humanus corporis]EEB12356.1 hypothetical protein Phum_PHUM173530 [Pediculus humanus corporis]